MRAGGLQHDRPAIHGAMNRPCKCHKESPQLTQALRSVHAQRPSQKRACCALSSACAVARLQDRSMLPDQPAHDTRPNAGCCMLGCRKTDADS